MHTTLTELDKQSIKAKLTAFRCNFTETKGHRSHTLRTLSLTAHVMLPTFRLSDSDCQDGGKGGFPVLVGGAYAEMKRRGLVLYRDEFLLIT